MERTTALQRIIYTAKQLRYTIVGIMDTPFFEDGYSVGYGTDPS